MASAVKIQFKTLQPDSYEFFMPMKMGLHMLKIWAQLEMPSQGVTTVASQSVMRSYSHIQSVKQPASQPASQTISQSCNQSISQSVVRSISQYHSYVQSQSLLTTVLVSHSVNHSRSRRLSSTVSHVKPVSHTQLTNRFHVAMHLSCNRSQMMSKCGKNKKVAHESIAECVTYVLTTF